MGTGYLQVTIAAANNALPVADAKVTVSQNGNKLYELTADANGLTEPAAIAAPDKEATLDPHYAGEPYARCDVEIIAQGFTAKRIYNVMVMDTVNMMLPVNMTPETAQDIIGAPRATAEPDDEARLPEHALVIGGERRQPHDEPDAVQPRILPNVVVPHYIVVHLGRPDERVSNVTVEFKHYIKNVCTHEIFPTWPRNAIEANIYAQISLALNRVYTEFYRSQGYPFDITSSTWNDQNFVYQGEVAPGISAIVDEVFNIYARRAGHKEPYFTEYCDGIKADCPGMKQWGTVTLAQQGKTPLQILQYYYGADIELTETYNIGDVEESYPGYLKEGSNGAPVRAVQNYLNRIRVNYPSIPQIPEADGYFGPKTSAAVKAFKKAANWSLSTSDTSGNVDRATWYNISYAYFAVKKLAQLASEGEVIGVSRTPPASVIQEGSRGEPVGKLQYVLNVIGDFYPEVRPTLQDYNFDRETYNSVVDFQKAFRLTQDGVVGAGTWRKLYEIYWKLKDDNLLNSPGASVPPYPGYVLRNGTSGEAVRQIQRCLNRVSSRYPTLPKLTEDGKFGNGTANAVKIFQQLFGLAADSLVGPATWRKIMAECQNSGGTVLPAYPGYLIGAGSSGGYVRQIQRCLNNLSNRYPSIPKLTPDGEYGNGTRGAVAAFQKVFGLKQDGIVGESTWNRMMRECGATAVSAAERTAEVFAPSRDGEQYADYDDETGGCGCAPSDGYEEDYYEDYGDLPAEPYPEPPSEDLQFFLLIMALMNTKRQCVC
ncbi:MAG: peptidoglycan-binding protein [Clostridiales bacterium]|jgi:peptidoglycan hydrolase-like protein with peptidoglycan-binding domain|nr:peptidoglycan-binding protein [Clostridiales bacterium]